VDVVGISDDEGDHSEQTQENLSNTAGSTTAQIAGETSSKAFPFHASKIETAPKGASMSVIEMFQQRRSPFLGPLRARGEFAGASYGVISNTDPKVVVPSPSVVP
jgi:hypothetical protein